VRSRRASPSKLFVANPTKLNQQKLLNAIEAGMRICRNATPADESGKKRQLIELAILTSHLGWAKSIGDDLTMLEQIVQSLETNEAVRTYQHWRQLATITR
jgi:hypothetical protein